MTGGLVLAVALAIRASAPSAHGFVVGFDEGSFLAVRPAFELLFEGDSVEDLVELGDVLEEQWTSAVRVGVGMDLVLVLPEAAIDVVGDADVERAVEAADA